MKKVFLVCLCGFVLMFLIACSGTDNHIVPDGAPMQREDFNSYKDGGIDEDIDQQEPLSMDDGTEFSGYIWIPESSKDVTTARNIKPGDKIDDMERAYAGITPEILDWDKSSEAAGMDSNSSYNAGVVEYTYGYDGYKLTIAVKDNVVTEITMANPEYLAYQAQRVEQNMRESLGDELYESLYG